MSHRLMHSEARLRAVIAPLGIAAIGISRANPDEQTQSRLLESLARGDLATWKYDATWAMQAANPLTLLPLARSVVSFAVPYAHAPPRRAGGTGRISNYAWSTIDYHDIMRTRGAALIKAISEIYGLQQSVVISDTKPLAERAVAARAGLGWIGKHTNLIVPQVGSFVFLGEVITTAVLEPDAPRATHCGSCRRCITVCPTGALRGDYTMDATRCISDLTQRRGIIPRELRPLMGDWVWGCDLCQDACPPTRRAGWTGDPAFVPRETAFPHLLDLLRLDGPSFAQHYATTAMGWRGSSLLRRNAAIALGNQLDRATVQPLLEQFAREASATVRAHIIWALERIDSPQARHGIAMIAGHERDPAVLAEITVTPTRRAL